MVVCEYILHLCKCVLRLTYVRIDSTLPLKLSIKTVCIFRVCVYNIVSMSARGPASYSKTHVIDLWV